MRRKSRLHEVAGALLHAQSGVIGRSQLIDLGVTRRAQDRLVAEGSLTRVTTGVLSAWGDPDWTGRAWAGIIVGGESAVLGFEAAGFLHGLLKAEPAEITVFVGRARYPAPRAGWRFVRASRPLGRYEPPRTSLEATLLDLCGDADEDRIAALLADALSGHRTTRTAVLAELAERHRQPQRRLIKEMLGDVSMGAHSALEWRYQTDIERAHALPTARRQTHAHVKHRNDAWYDDWGLLVELDSRLHHSGGAKFTDMTRDNDHALLGILTLRLGWGHVTGTTRCETALMIGQLLMSRGWEGPVTPCVHCRAAHAI